MSEEILKKAYQEIDLNGDGSISKSEMAAFVKKLMDTSGNYVLQKIKIDDGEIKAK